MDRSTITVAQKAFDAAEQAGDGNGLEALLAEDFLAIGPKGFVLDKTTWAHRHKQYNFTYEYKIVQRDIKSYGDCAVVRTVQDTTCIYNGESIHGVYRVVQVWVRQQDSWRCVSIQFTTKTDKEN